MRPQHLSDEAVAAFADGVLRGAARERAGRHTAECAECAHAVAVQREAVWALRAAPAPGLPSGLLDRLRDVPATTPIRTAPTVLGADGSPLLATFGALTSAALVAEARPTARPSGARWSGTARSSGTAGRHRKMLAVAGTAVAVAAAGVVAVGSAAHASGPTVSPPPQPNVVVVPASDSGR